MNQSVSKVVAQVYRWQNRGDDCPYLATCLEIGLTLAYSGQPGGLFWPKKGHMTMTLCGNCRKQTLDAHYVYHTLEVVRKKQQRKLAVYTLKALGDTEV